MGYLLSSASFRSLSVAIAVLTAAALLTGCVSTQTTSGRGYISRYAPPPPDSPEAEIHNEVLEVANIEPQLQFPARIGLVRIAHGEISPIPPEELEAWTKLVERLGPEYGEFAPVSPLVAQMVYESRGGENACGYAGRLENLVRKIRLGAARQHMDVVLIYEVFSRSDKITLPTAVANVTIIGAFIIPSEKTDTVGYANALLLDVRNGYPYGTASATTDKMRVYSAVGSWEKTRSLEERTEIATAVELVPEVETMLHELKGKLDAQTVVEAPAGK